VQDIQHPEQRLTRQFRFLARPRLALEETALWQVERLGFDRSEVQHIILTHLDFDHAGGLSDFPQATVHLLDQEYATVIETCHTASQNWLERSLHRYRYQPAQWSHHPHWVRYQAQGEEWFGFNCVRQLEGLPPEILLIPLSGHTFGHTGIAIQTAQGWLLHAGDAYYHHWEMQAESPSCPWGLAVVQRLGAMDNPARLQNQARLRQLQQNHPDRIQVISAHDPIEFANCN
jgi:glyoxylase-like metal-dependent hydrolase (beta-lactamase superfamily II)